MKPENKQMLFKLFKDVGTNLALTFGFAVAVIVAMHYFFHVNLQVSSDSLVIGIVGATLAFAGNNFMADGLGRWGAHKTPQFVWGNRIQSVGFALTLVALLIK